MDQIGRTHYSPTSGSTLIVPPEPGNCFFIHSTHGTLPTSPEPSASSDSTSMGTSEPSVIGGLAQHARGTFSCSGNGIGNWEAGGGTGKAVGEGGGRRKVCDRHELMGRSMELWRRTPCIRRRLWQTHSRDWRTSAVCTPCQSPYFIFALFALLMSLLVKYLHSHPLYTFATSLSSSA